MIGTRDITLERSQLKNKEVLFDKHEKYIKHYADDDEGTEQILAEYLKMSGMYWGLNTLLLMKAFDDQSITKVLKFIKQCQNTDGGFAAAPRHDSHILHTLSAIQILVMLAKCQPDYIDIDRCVEYISSLQQSNGSFFGDKWGEVDTRFSFCGLAALKLLDKIDFIDLDKAVEFVASCRNEIDGGFGSKPGSESHSAYVYCCVGSLAIANRLDIIDVDQLGQWLSERQLPSGGLNGRPEKLPDLCYSWWCLSSLSMIGKMHLIDHARLLNFILECQDKEQGGFSDRPGNWVDPFHTMFGIASLSLMCHNLRDVTSTINLSEEMNVEQMATFQSIMSGLRERLQIVDPILCMPQETLASLQSNKI